MNERLIQILSDALGIAPDALGNDPSMDTIAAWDSVAHLNIVMSIEQEFSVQFSPDELMELRSASALADALRKHNAA